MGYRHYMYIVPRKLVDEIKSLTYDELKVYAKECGALEKWDDDSWVDLHELFGHTEFYEFGKYYTNAENVYALGVPLFVNHDTQEAFSDYQPYVIGREAVLCAIEDYRKKIVDWYNGLLMTQEEYDETCYSWERGKVTQEERVKMHLTDIKERWENKFGLVPIDTSEKNSRIVTSWLFEHAIFELVHQLKIMDWENNTLLFYGW